MKRAKQISVCTIFVKDHKNRSFPITVPAKLEQVTVKHFKTLVDDKLGIPANDQQLIFGGKTLQDDTVLSDYPELKANSNIFLVRRLHGGTKDELIESIIAEIPTVDQQCSICFCSPSHKLPCGDLYCRDCVVQNTREAAKARKTMVKCSQCDKEWSLSVIRQYGSVNKKGIYNLADKLSENLILQNIRENEVWECPGCGCYGRREDKTKYRVHCQQCAAENKVADHCFHCARTWKKPSSSTDCGNPECETNLLELLTTAPLTKIAYSGVKCPSRRLCPKCGVIIEHAGLCKQMTCTMPSCLTKFCFICLSICEGGVWPCGSYSYRCKVAPIQLSGQEVKNQRQSWFGSLIRRFSGRGR